MATVTIQQDGLGDLPTFTTIAGALVTVDVSSDTYEMEITDDNAYAEDAILAATAGTPTASNYIAFRGGASNKHSGIGGTGHARIRITSAAQMANGRAIQISESHTLVEDLEIGIEDADSSDEGLRVMADVTGAVISRCIFWSSDTVTQFQDGVYTGQYDASYSIDNCVIYGFTRTGIHLQQADPNKDHTQVVDVDHCTVFNCGLTDEFESGEVFIRAAGNTDSLTVNAYNTIGCANPADAPNETD